MNISRSYYLWSISFLHPLFVYLSLFVHLSVYLPLVFSLHSAPQCYQTKGCV